MVSREAVAPTTSADHGYEKHPAYALIGASRITSNPGAVLYDSDLKHEHLVRVTLSHAVRFRSGMRDSHMATEEIVEVDLSEAQWASFVSSMNVGSGVPCTLRRDHGEEIPGMVHAPRLAASMAEVHTAAADAFATIEQAMADLEALDPKAGVKARREAQNRLKWAIKNATPNVDYAGEQLAEHAENVVQKARADVEAMVTAKAAQIGVDAGEIATPLVLGSGVDA